MASNPPQGLPDPVFPDSERLFRRVRRENLKSDGRPTLLAFELPDMSVNRERYGTDEDARKGFYPWDWGVVAFCVGDIPPRQSWAHVSHIYSLLPRHVPTPGNFAHKEIRLRRQEGERFILITYRGLADFSEHDADREEPLGSPLDHLDPDFHLRWRKHIALASKAVLPPADPPKSS